MMSDYIYIINWEIVRSGKVREKTFIDKEMKLDLDILNGATSKGNLSVLELKQKSLKSDIKIAMTGTPVENKLTELWSIFDFINKNSAFELLAEKGGCCLNKL